MTEQKQSKLWMPFNIYDFFGYFLPGFFLITILYLFFCFSNPQWYDLSALFYHKIASLHIRYYITLIAILLILTYLVGHFIATLSHILFDMIFVRGIVGHPVEIYLKHRFVKRDFSECTYKYLLCLLNSLILITVLPFHNDYNDILFDLMVYIIFILILFRLIITFFRLYKGNNYFHKKEQLPAWYKISQFCKQLYLPCCLYFIDPPLKIIERLFAIDKGFTDDFIQKHKELFSKIFGISSDTSGTNNLWLPYYHLNTTNPNISSIIKNWHYLYSFARNISTASFSTALFVTFWIHNNKLHSNGHLKMYLFTVLTIAWIFGVRYWLLYSVNYTKVIMRAFIASTNYEVGKLDNNKVIVRP